MKWCAVFLLVLVSGNSRFAQSYDYSDDDYDNYEYEAVKDFENFEGESEEEGNQDYQYEDNRISKEEYDDPLNPLDTDDLPWEEESFALPQKDIKSQVLSKDELPEEKEDPVAAAAEKKADYALLWGDDSIAPLPAEDIKSVEVEDNDILLHGVLDDVQQNVNDSNVELDKDLDIIRQEFQGQSNDEIETILDEAKQILESDNDEFDPESKDLYEEKNFKDNESEIIEETKNILANDVEGFDSEPIIDEKLENPKIEDVLEENKVDLGETNAVISEIEEVSNDEISMKDLDDNKTLNLEEETVDEVKEDLRKDLDKLGEIFNKLTQDDSEQGNSDNKSEEILDNADDVGLTNDQKENVDEDTENMNLDKLRQDLISENDEIRQSVIKALLQDEMNEQNPDDASDIDAENLPSKSTIAYISDALYDVANDKESFEENKSSDKTDASVETTNLNDLSSAELDDLMTQFAMIHEEIDINDPKLDEDSTPIHITLSVDAPTIITSPNYPENYPANNKVEWILDGPDGMGIEMNITDFDINSILGDYLLIKPGGVDDSGHDGLLFAYRLNSERRYRFFDVNRMFIRFKANPGIAFKKGFKISVKLIEARTSVESLPEPEPVTFEPNITARVTLGLPVPSFNEVKEDFRLVLAEMVTSYLAEQDMETDMDVDETLKIIHVSTCPVNWPGAERCTAVTFGINLENYIDLMAMWTQYNGVEPWVSTLAKLGIKDLPPPGMAPLTMWLVIASCIVVAMAVLSFVIWKYSCSDDYSRMKSTYSDAGSIIDEKRNLDLYPTPHQTLPPLYQMGHDTTVDMGGYNNKTYARETMYDFESDEEVSPRGRNGSISPRDYTHVA